MTQRTQPRGLLDRIAFAHPQETPDPRDILSSLGEVVYDWDLHSDRMRWGPNVEEVLGVVGGVRLASGRIYGERIAAETSPSPREAILGSRDRDLGAGVRYHLHYALLPSPASDRRIWVEDVGRWFAGPDGRPAKAHGVLRVLGDRSADACRLAPVHHDPLTGTLSRPRFVELARRLIEQGRHSGSRSAVMLIAIEDLSRINHLFGYDVADELLAATARRLCSLLRGGDLIARYAGNKFAVALGRCDSQQLSATAKRCLDVIAASEFETQAGRLHVSLRAGGAVAEPVIDDDGSLFVQAEEALETARTRGGPAFVLYQEGAMRESARRRTRVAAESIVAALNGRRIAIALEPVADARSGERAFYEALMRLRLENGELMAPAAAFDVAEKTGLAPLLDQRVLELALAHLVEEPGVTLSVNLSGLTAREPGWPERFGSTLAAFPGCARRLIVEITETCAIEDLAATRRTIAMLKDVGARVAMDDFGSGHTSFRNLRELSVDFIKIDGAFIQSLARSADDRFFVRTLVDLATHVGVPVVAEWVGDQETASLLRQWGVAYFQGELIGRAQEASSFDRSAIRGAAA